MKINRAYRVELDPNNRQRTAFRRAAGCARWAYNWGLRRKIDAWNERKAALEEGTSKAEAPKVPTAIDLHKELNLLKKLPPEQGGVPWMYESSKAAPQEALRNLDKAFENFFKKCKSKSNGPKGFPKFKSKKKGLGGFRLHDTVAKGNLIKLPRIGKVRLKERDYLPTKERTDVRVLGASVSAKAGRWFVSLQVEQELPDPQVDTTLPVLGVDLGVKVLATCSDGTVFENPKALKSGTKRLRMLQKSVSRKVVGSSNRRKSKERLARQHYRVSCVRKDALHKASDAITKRCSVLVLETLNVAGMLKNHCLAKAVADASMGEMHRQLLYKAAWRGVPLVLADRWFPSSKKCSSCGNVKKDLTLNDRECECAACGVVVDRDLNAARNLANLAGSSPVGGLPTQACGEA